MGEKKHILYLTQYFHPPEEGGLLRTWALTKHLASKNYSVTVIAAASHHMSGDIPKAYKGRLFSHLKHDGINVIKVYSLSQYRKNLFNRLVSYILYPVLTLLAALRIKRPDVVFTSTPPLTLLPVGYIVCLLKRIPYWIEMRDAWLEAAEGLNLIPKFSNRPLRFMRSLFFKRAEQIIAVTPGIQKIVQNYVEDKDKVTLVMNGFEESIQKRADLSKENIDVFKKTHGLTGKFVVTYTGTLGLARDHIIFGEVAHQLCEYQDILFLFVGEGEKKPDLQKRCGELHNCLFLPLQPRDKIPVILKASDVAVNSIGKDKGLESSLSNKIFDYLGNGVPVVFSGEGDTAKFLKESGGGIVVEPEDAKAMANAILTLRRRPELRKKMGKDGQDYVRTNYTRKQMTESLEKLLAESL